MTCWCPPPARAPQQTTAAAPRTVRSRDVTARRNRVLMGALSALHQSSYAMTPVKLHIPSTNRVAAPAACNAD